MLMIHLTKKWALFLSFSKRNPPQSLSTLSISLSHIIFSEALFVDHSCRSNGLPPQKSRVSLLDVGLKFVLKLGLFSPHLLESEVVSDFGWMWLEKTQGTEVKGRYGCFRNRCGTPKSSILIGFSIIKFIHFGVPLFLETPIFVSLRPLVSGGGSGGLPHTPEPGANVFFQICVGKMLEKVSENHWETS